MPESVELPLYQSHKRVRAAKITHIERKPDPVSGRVTITLSLGELPRVERVHVDLREWVYHRMPREGKAMVYAETSLLGGYYVVYDNGHTSWSPAKAFEEGYTRVE